MKKKLGGFEMKPIFRLLVAISVIAFAAGVMAVSCDKDAGGGNNNTNTNSGGSGGSGGNGPLTPLGGTLKITPANANVTVSGNDITIKTAAFPTAALVITGTGYSQAMGFVFNANPGTVVNKAFDIEYDGGTGGLVLVANGNVTKPEDITITDIAGITNDTFEGIQAVSKTTAAGLIPAGLSFFSIFGSTNVPANDAETAADAAPFAFTITPATRPIFWCVATAPGITEDIAADIATILTLAQKPLTGAHKASCYVAATSSSSGSAGLGLGTAGVATAWFTANGTGTGTAATTAGIKKAIKVSVGAIRTDARPLNNIGLPGNTDAAKLGVLAGGLTATEMKALIDANKGSVLFGQYTITITQ